MSQFYSPEDYGELNDSLSEILITTSQIEERVMELGQSISRDYDGCNPTLVGVLNGVVPFIAALLPAITIPLEVDFMTVSNYRNEEE